MSRRTAKKRSDKEKDEIYREWKELINMGPEELEEWAKDPDRLKASISRQEAKSEHGGIHSGYDSLHRIKRRVKKPRSEWTDEDYDNAAQENSFNSRMLGNDPGEPVGDTGRSKWEISLRNWGHSPSKSSSPGNARYKAWKKKHSGKKATLLGKTVRLAYRCPEYRPVLLPIVLGKEKQVIPGGLGENLDPSDVDPKQLAKGRKVEKEHGGTPEMHTEIALDHLKENPRYYDYLEEMEKRMEKSAIGNEDVVRILRDVDWWRDREARKQLEKLIPRRNLEERDLREIYRMLRRRIAPQEANFIRELLDWPEISEPVLEQEDADTLEEAPWLYPHLSDWQGYEYKLYYATWTPEDREAGEASEEGDGDEGEETSLEGALSSIDNHSWLEWSSSPPSSRDWLISEGEDDYGTGETTYYTAFIKRVDGSELSREEIAFISKSLHIR